MTTFADDVRAALRAPGALMIPAPIRQLLQDAAGHIETLQGRADCQAAELAELRAELQAAAERIDCLRDEVMELADDLALDRRANDGRGDRFNNCSSD